MDQQTKPKRRATPASWKPGQSGNPGGRPRSGYAFADRVRERVDPDIVIDLALRLAADEDVPLERRLAALLPLYAAGFLRPPSATSIEVRPAAPSADFSAMPLEARVALLAEIRGRLALAAAPDGPRLDAPADDVDADDAGDTTASSRESE